MVAVMVFSAIEALLVVVWLPFADRADDGTGPSWKLSPVLLLTALSALVPAL